MPQSGKEMGYGTFLVSPDVVMDAPTGGRKNVYLGRENEPVAGYSLRTGESGGKDVYTKARRTAGLER